MTTEDGEIKAGKCPFCLFSTVTCRCQMTDDPPSAKNLENAWYGSGAQGGKTALQTEIVAPGYCGIFGAETGKRDPFHWACSTLHDPRYQALLDGKDPGRTNVQTQWDFTKGILSTMAEGLYAVVTGPFYILFGAVLGGSLRFTQLQRRQAAKEGKPWPKNETED